METRDNIEEKKSVEFSWNLDLGGKAKIEGHDVNLHNKIELNFCDLGDIKKRIVSEVVSVLTEDGRTKMKKLIEIKDKQVVSNNEKIKDLREMNKGLNGRYPRIGDEVKEISKALINILINAQNDLEKEEEYFGKYRILLNNEKDEQNQGISVEGWGTLLSLSEKDAPRINFNIEGESYKITKGERYGEEDWEGKIKESIRNIIIGNDNCDNNCDNNVDSILKFILSPFKIEGGYDEETVRYYVYSIIDCINKGDFIGKLLTLKEGLENKLSALKEVNNQIKKIDGKYNEIQLEYDKNNESEENSGNDETQKGENSGNILENLEKVATIDYLEGLNNNDTELSKLIGSNPLDLVKQFIGEYISSFKEGKQGNEQLSLNDRLSFENKCKQILKFLGKQEDENVGKAILYFYYLMIAGCLGSKKIDGSIIEFDEAELLFRGNVLISRIDREESINDNEVDTLNRSKELLNNLSWVGETKSDTWRMRREIINEKFNSIFGVYFSDSDLRSLGYGKSKNETDLVNFMMKKLVEKINKDKMARDSKKNRVIKNILSSWNEKKESNEYLISLINERLENFLNDYFIKDHDRIQGILTGAGKIEGMENLDEYEQQLENLDFCEFDRIRGEFEKMEDQVNGIDTQQMGLITKMMDSCTISDDKDISEVEPFTLKWLIVLKRLFKCEDLTLGKKFQYAKRILRNVSGDTDKRFDDNNIIDSLIVGKNNNESDTDENIEENRYKKKEKNFLQSISRVDESRQIDEFIEGLGRLGLSNLGSDYGNFINELKKMDKIFSGVIKLYIDECVNKRALKFGDSSCAINYRTGKFDFSVIQAGILKKALEYKQVTAVLEYLGFKFDIVEKMRDRINRENINTASTILPIIEQYQQKKVGCFDLSREQRVCIFPPYVRAQGDGVFTIGENKDPYRFDGLIDGGFVIKNYFSQEGDGNSWHGKHEACVKSLKGENDGNGKKNGKKK